MKRSLKKLGWPVLLFLGVIILWFFTPWAIGVALALNGSPVTLANTALFGNQFGAVTALFSGLAFAGVVVNLWLQRETTQTHLLLTRNQMKQLADAIMAQTEIASSATQATQGQAFSIASGIMQADRARLARKFTYKLLRTKEHLFWSPTDKTQAELVCHTFDQIGIMVKNHMVNPQTIYDGWHQSILESWKILEPSIRSRRKEFGSENAGTGFKFLYEEMKKIKKAEVVRLSTYKDLPGAAQQE